MMDLLYTDTEDAVRESVARLLQRHVTTEVLLRRYDPDIITSTADSPWSELGADLGLAGLLLPEACGGEGNRAREAAVVLEELGRALTPVPFLTSAVIASTCLTVAGADPDLLGRLARGDTTAALVAPWTLADPRCVTRLKLREDGTLEGSVTSVAHGDSDILIVVADAHDGPQLRLVRSGSVGLKTVRVVALDMTRPLHDLSFTACTSEPLVSGEAVFEALDHSLRVGAALLASEQVGIAQWCLDETIRYLTVRYQFGRALASFQALKHRLADLAGDLMTARAAARYAAACAADASSDLAVAAGLAQAHCSLVAVKAAEECLQLHGGIGMTWEHPAHLYLKRAKSDELALGSPAEHRTVLADLVGISPAAQGQLSTW